MSRRTYTPTALRHGRYTVAAVRHRHAYTVLDDSGRVAATAQDAEGRPVPALWPTIRDAARFMRTL